MPPTKSKDEPDGHNKSSSTQKLARFCFVITDGTFVTGKLESDVAGIFAGIIMSTIVLSIIVMILQSMEFGQYMPTSCQEPACDNDPDLCPGIMMCQPEPHAFLRTIEFVCIIVFTVEYAIRFLNLWAVSSREADIIPSNWGLGQDDPVYSLPEQYLRFVFNVKNIVDIVTIIPFWILLASNSHGSTGFLRVLRCLRVFKLLRRFESLQLMLELVFKTFEMTIPTLSVMVLLMIIGMIFFGSIIYVIEGGVYTVSSDFPNGQFVRRTYNGVTWEISPYQTIPSAMYWFFVTACTVGYGDLVPTSPLGRAVSCVVMIVGLLVLGMPIAVIGSSFTDAYKVEVSAMLARTGAGLGLHKMSEQQMHELFDEIDDDGNEVLQEDEIYLMIKQRGIMIDKFWFKAMLVAEDPNGDGLFTRSEFINLCLKMKDQINTSLNYSSKKGKKMEEKKAKLTGGPKGDGDDNKTEESKIVPTTTSALSALVTVAPANHDVRPAADTSFELYSQFPNEYEFVPFSHDNEMHMSKSLSESSPLARAKADQYTPKDSPHSATSLKWQLSKIKEYTRRWLVDVVNVDEAYQHQLDRAKQARNADVSKLDDLFQQELQRLKEEHDNLFQQQLKRLKEEHDLKLKEADRLHQQEVEKIQQQKKRSLAEVMAQDVTVADFD